MKSFILFLSFLLPVTSVFAQSKKKKNGLLKMELHARQESYDSLRYVYYVETFEFEKGVKRSYQELMIAFPRQEAEIEKLESTIAENQAKLMKLKEPVSGLKDVSLPKYSFTSGLKKELLSFDPFYEELEKKTIPDEKLKIQNQFLENRIHLFDSLFAVNGKTIRTLRLCKVELSSLCATLSEQLKTYNGYVDYLNMENDTLRRRLHELEENYLSKGPRGFPSEYHEVFPNGRVGNVERDYNDASEVHSYVTEDAEFPGGNEGLKYYLGTHFIIPQIALELGIQGKAWVRFIIGEDGSVSEVKMVRGFTDCPECDLEAIRVIRMMPKWNPAIMEGRAVKSMFQVPIEIKLN